MRTGILIFKRGAFFVGLLWMGLVSPLPSHAQEAGAPAQTRADMWVEKADSLRDERQFEAAQDAYRQARTLYRDADARREVVATTSGIGVLHYRSGDLEAALQSFRRAVATAREVGATEEVANLLNNVGLIEWRRGEYDAALQNLEASARMHREMNNRKRVGKALNNIANIHEERGEYRQALRKYRQALNIARMERDTADVASYLNNIGLVLRSQGQYDQARRHHQQALELHRALGTKTGMADALNNLGIVWRAKDEYEKALQTYEKALQINRDLEDRSSIAANLTNIGSIYQRQGRSRKAEPLFQEALRISREVGNRASESIVLNDLAAVYRSQGKYEDALAVQRKALQMNRSIGRSEGVAKSLDGIAITHLERGRYVAADSALRKSIAITDTLIETATGENRRDYLAKEVGRFHKRVVAQVRAGRAEAALRTLERSRTRVFAEQLAGAAGENAGVPPIDSLQRALAPHEAAVLYANTDAHGPITAFVVTREAVQAHELADSAFVDWARRAFDDELRQLRRQEHALMAEARGLDTEETLAEVVQLYRRDLAVGPEQQLLSTARRRVLGRELYSLLIAPLEESLARADELVVVPDGALAYLPFEVLSTPKKSYLVERWRVQYTQSLRVLHLLRRREAQSPDSTARRSLLALGGAAYDTEDNPPDTAASAPAKMLAEARSRQPRNQAGRALPEPRRPMRERGLASGRVETRSYRKLGYEPDRWSNLAGTLQEIRALERIVGASTLLVGERASEQSVRTLSRSGALDDYRALHFATHGIVVPEAPSLSALVLAEAGRESGREGSRDRNDTTALAAVDGYLNMREIAELDLDAEFVALSACKTGLGRIYRGSGSVSLAQAFLRAGAGAVTVSLWPVYDASTSRFMQAVYRRAWQYETTWAEAIAETKRAFIDGDYGERLRAPRFWAPFVYYGREARTPDAGQRSGRQRR